MTQRGGKRPGAGRKPGSKNRATKQEKATLSDLAKEHGQEAVDALVRVMNDPGQTGTAIVAAANSILDRAYGKPRQEVEHTAKDALPFTGFVIERAKPDPDQPD